MGAWTHRLTERDTQARTAMCAACGPVKLKFDGQVWKCKKAWNNRDRHTQHLRRRPYTAAKEQICRRCGFTPEHACQLDVNHIDCNHNNNDPTNLETLCANCHRLITWQEGHYAKGPSH